MTTKKQTVFPKYDKVLRQIGENIKMAHKRRKLTVVQVAERADSARSTLHLKPIAQKCILCPQS